MNRDPVVEEVHRTRQKLLNGCSGDLDRLLDRVKAGEKNHHNLVVTNSPLPVKTYVMKETESLVRSILGTVPLFGTTLNEAFFDLRARLKHERLERFIEDLAKNVHSLETEKIDTGYIHSEEFVDFLEDVLIRATKIRADEKREKLAAVLAARIQDGEGTPFDDRFLDLLISLTEMQIRILDEHLRAAERRDESNKGISEASREHRQPGYYEISDSNYRFLVQDLLARSLLYTHRAGRGDLGPLQFLEVTELGEAFVRFLEKGTAHAL